MAPGTASTDLFAFVSDNGKAKHAQSYLALMRMQIFLAMLLAFSPVALAEPEPQDEVADTLYALACVSVRPPPPDVDVGGDCGPVAYLERKVLP